MKGYEVPARVTAMLIDVAGIVSNSLSLSYFMKRGYKGLGNRLLMVLNTFDLLVCVCNLCTFISLEVYSVQLGVFYYMSAFCYYVTFDCTGFLTCLISVTRTIGVCRPFYSINGGWVSASFLTYLLFSLARESTRYSLELIKPESTASLSMAKSYPLIFAFETFSNMMAVLLSSVITAYWLLYKTKFKRRVSKNNRRATVTVLILSAVFFLINITFISATVISYCFWIKVLQISPTSSWYVYTEIVFTLTQCLNSTVNPMIYLTRKKEMRQFVLKILEVVRNKLSRPKVRPVSEM